MIAQFLLSLSIIVGLHELGHLLFAKLFGMRVESYAIGFSPKLLRYKWGETEYSIGAIPLGGAVKISGMVDESLDTPSECSVPQPWEFRAKPAWQRLLVMLGGILFNVITGMVIYAVIAFSLGDTYLPKEEVNKHGIVPNEIGISLGFKEGDKIIDISGKDFANFSEVMKPHTLLATNGYYTVLRQEETVRLDIPANFIERLSEIKKQGAFVAPRLPYEVAQVQEKGGAAEAGLQPGDKIIEVAGKAAIYFHQLRKVLEENAGKQVPIQYVRAGEMQVTTGQVSEEGRLGFHPKVLLAYEKRNYNLGQAMSIGAFNAFDVTRSNVLAFGKDRQTQLIM